MMFIELSAVVKCFNAKRADNITLWKAFLFLVQILTAKVFQLEPLVLCLDTFHVCMHQFWKSWVVINVCHLKMENKFVYEEINWKELKIREEEKDICGKFIKPKRKRKSKLFGHSMRKQKLRNPTISENESDWGREKNILN